MDENGKKQFRWKFYHLAVELNIIILLFALPVPMFLIIHSPLVLPVIVLMLAAALVLSADFVKRYRTTRAWLDSTPDKEKDEKTDAGL